MSGNGDGKTDGKGAEGAPRPSFDEELAAMPDRDRIDRLTRFTMSQFNDLFPAFRSQAAPIPLLADQVSALATEVAALRAQRDKPSEDQVTLQ